MDNIIKIAEKEFLDLVNSRLVLIILSVYVLLIFKTVYDIYMSIPQSESNFIVYILLGLWYNLTAYGSLVCIVIGFSSISSEMATGALNTLVVKPVHRDTVINGKLLGILGFLTCIFTISSILYLSVIITCFGASIASMIADFLLRVAVIILLSMIYVLVFLLLSMLFSILVRDRPIALILSMLALSISQLFYNVGFISNICMILGISDLSTQNSIAELSPDAMSMVITNNLDLFNPLMNLWAALQPVWIDVGKLALYAFILIVVNYIVFIRSDIS